MESILNWGTNTLVNCVRNIQSRYNLETVHFNIVGGDSTTEEVFRDFTKETDIKNLPKLLQKLSHQVRLMKTASSQSSTCCYFPMFDLWGTSRTGNVVALARVTVGEFTSKVNQGFFDISNLLRTISIQEGNICLSIIGDTYYRGAVLTKDLERLVNIPDFRGSQLDDLDFYLSNDTAQCVVDRMIGNNTVMQVDLHNRKLIFYKGGIISHQNNDAFMLNAKDYYTGL